MADQIYEKLINIVGEDYVSNDESVMYPYSYDVGNLTSGSNPEGMGEYLVMPDNVEQVQKIVLIANEEKVPITPYISGANMGGCAVPSKGGIIMDLRRMNRIVEVNEKADYIVIEPGVSIGQFEKKLKEINRWIPFPLAPPAAASVVGNVLLTGIGHVSAQYGCNGELVNAMEVVLPTGKIVKVGSAGLVNSWHSRFPVPDLTGLFLNWQGTTGIVTKMSVVMYQRPEYRDVITFGFDSYEEAVDEFMIPLQRRELAHDITGINWALAQIPIKKWPLSEKPEKDPLIFVFNVLAGYTVDELEFKQKQLRAFASELKKSGKTPSIKEVELPDKTKEYRAVKIPNPWAFLYADHRDGGSVYWCGSLMPADGWVEAYKKADKIMENHGLAPATRVSMFKGSHYGMFRSIIPYNKGDEKEVENIRQTAIELTQNVIEHGGILYKAPPWAAEMLLNSEYADPEFKEFMRLIKKTLDPNGIMNPGKWGL